MQVPDLSTTDCIVLIAIILAFIVLSNWESMTSLYSIHRNCDRFGLPKKGVLASVYYACRQTFF